MVIIFRPMKLSESFIASIKEKYGNPATIEDLFMVLTQDLSQAYDVNPEEKEAILELIKELP